MEPRGCIGGLQGESGVGRYKRAAGAEHLESTEGRPELEIGNLRNKVEGALGPADSVVPARVGLKVDHGQAVAGRSLDDAPAGVLDDVDLAESSIGGLLSRVRRNKLAEHALRMRGRDDLVDKRVQDQRRRARALLSAGMRPLGSLR